MSEQKLTPWFPWTVTPVREGVYSTKYKQDAIGFSYWTGNRWGSTFQTKGAAMFHAKAFGPCFTQEKQWRGLAKEPK
jgi:hypothetical protein